MVKKHLIGFAEVIAAGFFHGHDTVPVAASPAQSKVRTVLALAVRRFLVREKTDFHSFFVYFIKTGIV